jgi:hypothetical protein
MDPIDNIQHKSKRLYAELIRARAPANGNSEDSLGADGTDGQTSVHCLILLNFSGVRRLNLDSESGTGGAGRDRTDE